MDPSTSIASSIAFHPGFITPAEEASLLNSLSLTSPGWTLVAGRRVRSVGGSVDPRGALVPAPLPGWAARLCDKLVADSVWPADVAPPNHTLVNWYASGSGILPHEDGPSYHPVAAILSLGGWAVLRFYAKPPDGSPVDTAAPPCVSVAAPPCSLVVFSGEAYTHALHGIDAVEEEVLDGSIVNVGEAGLWLGGGGGVCGVCGRRAGGGGDATETLTKNQRPCFCGLTATRTLPRAEARVSLTVRAVVRVRKGLALRL